MEGEGEVEAQVREFRKLDQMFEVRDKYVFDIVLSFGPIHELKSRFKTFET